MEHPFLVSRRQARTKLPSDLNPLVPWQPADAAQQALQVLAVDVFHREEVLAVYFVDIVNPADVWVRDLPGQRTSLRNI